MEDNELIEKLNQIKLKLNKYAESNQENKVKDYIQALTDFRINLEVLKKTEIVICLKNLKKKENPVYSSRANDLINKWKDYITNFQQKQLKAESNQTTINSKNNNNVKNASDKQTKPVSSSSSTSITSTSSSASSKLSNNSNSSNKIQQNKSHSQSAPNNLVSKDKSHQASSNNHNSNLKPSQTTSNSTKIITGNGNHTTLNKSSNSASIASKTTNGNSNAMNKNKNLIKKETNDLNLKQESNNNNNKKRQSASTKPNDDHNSETAKKQKLSLSDYKLKKGGVESFDLFNNEKSNNSNEEDECTSSYNSKSNGENDFGLDFQLSDDDEDNSSKSIKTISKDIKSLSKNIKQENKNENSKLNIKLEETLTNGQNSKTNDQKNLIKIPPKPSAPLSSILAINPQTSSSVANSSQVSSTFGRKSLNTQVFATMPSKQSLESNDDELARIFKEKHSKKTLYTGKKTGSSTGTTVLQSLYDLCVRTLTENLDDFAYRIFEYNSNPWHEYALPFQPVKPIIEKANARQLIAIEDYHNDFLNDTDYIWERVTKQELKCNEKPEEDESWRELYFKKLDEREEKFQRARLKVSSMQASKAKERQTQLATVKFIAPGSKSAPIAKAKIVAQSMGGTVPPIRNPILEAVPIRKAIGSGEGGFKKPFAPAPPVRSQGMRDIQKLLKKGKIRR